MISILYDEKTAQPVTVVDVPDYLIEGVLDGTRRYIRMHVIDESTTNMKLNSLDLTCEAKIVDLEPLILVSGRTKLKSVQFWVRDHELAMKLKATFLIGQQREVRERESMARAEGQLDLLTKLIFGG